MNKYRVLKPYPKKITNSGRLITLRKGMSVYLKKEAQVLRLVKLGHIKPIIELPNKTKKKASKPKKRFKSASKESKKYEAKKEAKQEDSYKEAEKQSDKSELKEQSDSKKKSKSEYLNKKNKGKS